MSRILLINPPSARSIYQRSKLRAAVFHFPPLSLATVGAALLERGQEVRVLDMAGMRNPLDELKRALGEFEPDWVGITFTTPLCSEACRISRIVKEFNPSIRVVGGGQHSSALPEETLASSAMDAVVIGEGDRTFAEMIAGERPWSEIPGLAYMDGARLAATPPAPIIQELDDLPLPAWELFAPQVYNCSKIISRANPVAAIETSRGCPFGCIYCSKAVFGRRFRYKSPQRVVSEMRKALSLGFREVHIIDDLFTANMRRAKEVLRAIVDSEIDCPWQLPNGIRVSQVDEEFVSLASQAGCYSIGLGVESGNQELLDNVKKQTTLAEGRRTVKLIQDQGIEVVCFFMLGLTGETEETMQATIDFACELNPDFAKATIMYPLPGTPLFDQLEREGRLKTREWSLYSYHYAETVYDHWNLDAETLKSYYHRFYRRFYLRPAYLMRRIPKAIRQGNLVSYTGYFLQTWAPWLSGIRSPRQEAAQGSHS